MAERISKKGSKVLACCLAMTGLVAIVGITIHANSGLAQELTEESVHKDMIAKAQYAMQYRFDRNLKVGDWIKYREHYEFEEDLEYETRVTKEEKGGVWIVDKSPEGEIHMLVNLERMALIEGFSLDGQGSKRAMTPLNEEELTKRVADIKRAEIVGSPTTANYLTGTQKEKVEVPAGTYTCVYLEPEFTKEFSELMPASVLEDQKKGMRLYFSEDVPRLIPVKVVILATVAEFSKAGGGMVKRGNLELVAYSGQKK